MAASSSQSRARWSGGLLGEGRYALGARSCAGVPGVWQHRGGRCANTPCASMGPTCASTCCQRRNRPRRSAVAWLTIPLDVCAAAQGRRHHAVADGPQFLAAMMTLFAPIPRTPSTATEMLPSPERLHRGRYNTFYPADAIGRLCATCDSPTTVRTCVCMLAGCVSLNPETH